ncbi:hypothetical protein CPB85DRAFT_1288716 [Mucidula mucida]|nr:hypothetical protein CPB85DRAFT_1288716 [Mucidula mucida]
MSTLTESGPRDRDDLASYFDRSAYVVHSYADRLEHGYARPAIKTAKELLQEHPIPFVCTSNHTPIPVLTFIRAVLVTLSFVFLALSSALLASAGFLFMACMSSLVAQILLSPPARALTNLCISIFPTAALFWSYTWVDETKTFVGSGLGFKAAPKTEDNTNASPRSEGSMVLQDPSQDPENG